MNRETMLLYLAGVSNKYLTMNVLCHGVVYAAIILYFGVTIQNRPYSKMKSG